MRKIIEVIIFCCESFSIVPLCISGRSKMSFCNKNPVVGQVKGVIQPPSKEGGVKGLQKAYCSIGVIIGEVTGLGGRPSGYRGMSYMKPHKMADEVNKTVKD